MQGCLIGPRPSVAGLWRPARLSDRLVIGYYWSGEEASGKTCCVGPRNWRGLAYGVHAYGVYEKVVDR